MRCTSFLGFSQTRSGKSHVWSYAFSSMQCLAWLLTKALHTTHSSKSSWTSWIRNGRVSADVLTWRPERVSNCLNLDPAVLARLLAFLALAWPLLPSAASELGFKYFILTNCACAHTHPLNHWSWSTESYYHYHDFIGTDSQVRGYEYDSSQSCLGLPNMRHIGLWPMFANIAWWTAHATCPLTVDHIFYSDGSTD